jgi:hypothetical protein
MLRQLVVIAAALAASGCFSSATVVTLRGDGSGTIQVTSVVRKIAVAQLHALIDAAGHRPTTREVEDWFPEQQARAAAARLGSGVQFVATRTIDSDRELGRVTRYDFADIRRVTLEPIPLFPQPEGFSADARLEGEHRVIFDLVDEGESGRVLVARMPDARIEYAGLETSTGAEKPTPAEDVALLRTFVSGGRLEVTLELEPSIVRTNTPHRDGQRITLVALDFETLLLNETVATRLLIRPGSFDELRHRLHDAPGVTVGLDREIRVELARD